MSVAISMIIPQRLSGVATVQETAQLSLALLDTLVTRLAKLAACKPTRARLVFDDIVWSKKTVASESAMRAWRQAARSLLSAGRQRGRIARRSSSSIASKRLKIEAVESVASFPKAFDHGWKNIAFCFDFSFDYH